MLPAGGAILSKKHAYLQQKFIDEVDPGLLERHSRTQRNRNYLDHPTFWAFFSQVAGDAASCAELCIEE
jgi:hypothetical protein